MKRFFSVVFLLACIIAYDALAAEIYKNKNSPNFADLDKYAIDISIDNLKGFKKLVMGENISGLEYHGCDRRKYKAFYDKDIPFLAFIRSIKDNKISLHLVPDLYELNSSEVVEQINVHIKDNENINQKSIYFSREIQNKQVKEIIVAPVVCYWGAKTEIELPDVGKWANQYSSTIIPTNLKLIINALPK